MNKPSATALVNYCSLPVESTLGCLPVFINVDSQRYTLVAGGLFKHKAGKIDRVMRQVANKENNGWCCCLYSSPASLRHWQHECGICQLVETRRECRKFSIHIELFISGILAPPVKVKLITQLGRQASNVHNVHPVAIPRVKQVMPPVSSYLFF